MRTTPYIHWLLALSTALLIQACGGGGGGGGSSTSNSPAPSNTVAVTVGSGLSSSMTNMMMTSVTICKPGTSVCITVPNIQVDTGSTGLRVFASLLNTANNGAGLNLTAITSSTTGNAIYNCTAFGDGVVWGNMATADVKLGGESAPGISIHVMQDTTAGAPIPTLCTNQGSNETSILGTGTVHPFGANGIIGIGLYNQDCGTYCVNSVYTAAPKYYACDNANVCVGTTVALTQQTANPVASFASINNNGVALQFPAIASNGVTSVIGSLIFGIGTQTNNAESATAIKIATPYASNGLFTATYKGTSLSQSFIDSGSSGYYFVDNTIATCTQQTAYFCPGGVSNSLSPLSISASVPNSNTSTSATISMVVASADYLFNENNGALGAFNDIGAPNSMSTSFDFGVPFFFGKTVFTSNENVGPANMHFAYQAYTGN